MNNMIKSNWHPHNWHPTISITNNSIASKLHFIQMGSTIFEICLDIFCTELTPWHYRLLTERRLYQGLHQRKYTHCEALGYGLIMACQVICLWRKILIMCHICWLVCICEGKWIVSRRCLRIWAEYEGRCCVQSSHFQMPWLSAY